MTMKVLQSGLFQLPDWARVFFLLPKAQPKKCFRWSINPSFSMA